MSERDPELDALWRRHSRDEPPAAIDDAIRAAAHRAVHAKPAASPRARAPWPAWATLAAAASIGAIAIGVWQLQPREFDESKVVASDVPRRAETRREAMAPAAPPPEVALDSATTRAPSSAGGERLQQRGDAARAPDAVAREAAKPAPFPGTSGKMAPSARDAARPAQSAGARASADDAQSAMAAPAPPAAASGLRALPAPSVTSEANRPQSTARFAEPAAKAADSQTPHDAKAMESTSRFAEPAAEVANAQASSDAKAATASGPARFAAPAAKVAGAQAPADATAATAASTPRSATAPAPMRMRVDKSASPRSVAEFVDAIRRALADHRDDVARAELVAMRAQYTDADAQLPPELRTWATSVPRASP